MGLIKGVQIRTLESIQGGMMEFYPPQSSNENMVVTTRAFPCSVGVPCLGARREASPLGRLLVSIPLRLTPP
ncbi:MAG: hypothetical protein QNJ55_02175 [Xenococcus sp. MO_188.B8]|nr:hypothetical protein [Xenococcus sp. MO_188.B8]